MADEDEYGPVAYERRRPARHWSPEGSLQPRPQLSQPVASYKLLNRSTQQDTPGRATNNKDRLPKVRPDPGPARLRIAPPDVRELLRQEDEDESNRLNVFDGYSPTPARPRGGFGLQLRPQHPDNGLMEILDGPKWHDPRGTERPPPYVEVVETRPTPTPPPQIVRNRKPRLLYKEEGETIVRPPSPPPKPALIKVLRGDNIFFEGYSPLDAASRRPARFRGPGYLTDIQEVADLLHENPGVKVRIRASVGSDGSSAPIGWTDEDVKNWIKLTMIRRNQAVANQLKARGIEPKRISTEMGDIGSGEKDRKVEFFFDPPAVRRRPANDR